MAALGPTGWLSTTLRLSRSIEGDRKAGKPTRAHTECCTSRGGETLETPKTGAVEFIERARAGVPSSAGIVSRNCQRRDNESLNGPAKVGASDRRADQICPAGVERALWRHTAAVARLRLPPVGRRHT